MAIAINPFVNILLAIGGVVAILDSSWRKRTINRRKAFLIVFGVTIVSDVAVYFAIAMMDLSGC